LTKAPSIGSDRNETVVPIRFYHVTVMLIFVVVNVVIISTRARRNDVYEIRKQSASSVCVLRERKYSAKRNLNYIKLRLVILSRSDIRHFSHRILPGIFLPYPGASRRLSLQKLIWFRHDRLRTQTSFRHAHFRPVV